MAPWAAPNGAEWRSGKSGGGAWFRLAPLKATNVVFKCCLKRDYLAFIEKERQFFVLLCCF